MIDLKYTITFFSNWHCGSGQAAGADVDELVIKDYDGLPYVPGRTLKGLLRDAADLLVCHDGLDQDILDKLFGNDDNHGQHGELTTMGKLFFSNAELPERSTIAAQGLVNYLYQSFSATAIGDDGIAKDLSLRKIQTVIPCTLQGAILHVPDEHVAAIKKMASLIKHIGLGRSHGFGRCQMKIQ